MTNFTRLVSFCLSKMQTKSPRTLTLTLFKILRFFCPDSARTPCPGSDERVTHADDEQGVHSKPRRTCICNIIKLYLLVFSKIKYLLLFLYSY